MTTTDSDSIRDKVRDGYAAIALSGQWSGVTHGPTAGDRGCHSRGGCCGPATLTAAQVALAVGYGAADLSTLPDGANMGLSCGNPTAPASLAPGETVLDLGSGGGLDCFIAGARVGATGRVIGVDMTAEMIGKARSGVSVYEKQSGFSNVEFRLGEIENLPVADASVDVVISNCVINLSPDKKRVWREITRVLRPGGRVAVSDLALLRPLPREVAEDLEALVGCIAGAQLIDEVRASAGEAGLVDIELIVKPQYVEAMVNSEDPLYKAVGEALPAGTRIGDYVASVNLAARRPSW